MNNCYISLLPALWLGSRVFPFQIDNSVPVSCDVAAGACFFCYGFIGRLSKVRQNVSIKTLPYLTLHEGGDGLHPHAMGDSGGLA